MADPFVAEIRIFGFNFAPKGWAFCQGQILPLSQNTALFSLLGTTYGGDGKSNFALPNLQGSAPMFWGQGPGLSLHDIGEISGSENITLLQSEMPIHSHQVSVVADLSNSGGIPGPQSYLAIANIPTYNSVANTSMSPNQLSITGGSLPHNNMQPYLTLNFCIALQGVFPPRQ
ncbi:phage tail protein [Lacihabitans soyangensis]|uniref:Phage tail protein n=1 Tax=Lacihabitans soyangensis TaxID=869394 RepID=A0AAE3KWQ6_9BACT|nr:tail fiber protein [Lacihabitans soyangensis]MCP9763285.1 phage tail protein [Lacihabitans soyangensis]